ncbi:hypothetical protein ACIG54_37070 [Streptomyces achromogenes]|uniref:hypothetical protein n=1 Tax=Streptomyces achromogenes TaxID=67255 RepID=UPI0037D146ED
MALAFTRQFVWTVIPGGRAETAEGRALFSVLLTPRLLAPPEATPTVAQFGMQTWPSRLKDMDFAAHRGDRRLTLTRLRPATEDGQPFCTPEQQLAAWRTMFPASLPVRPYQPTSYRDRQVRVFPADEAGTEIKQAYARTTRALARTDDCDHRQRARRQEALQEIARNWQSAATLSDRSTGEAEDSPLVRAYLFYRRENPDLATPAEEDARVLDFHDVVARLAGHPLLLRALGLVVDFAVPVAELASTDGPAHLRVEPLWPDPDPGAPAGWANARQDDLLPTTAYSLAGSRFVPLMPPASGTARPQGMLPLAKVTLAGTPTNSPYSVMPFDVDSAALRMVSVAQSDRGQVPPEAADAAGLPALRSTGFSLIERTRRGEHSARLQRATDRDTPQKLLGSPLTAENLLAGYRLDVFAAGKWHSLCRRQVRYTIGGVTLPPEPGLPGLLDEGFVPVGSATTSSGAGTALNIHEIVARWDGWNQVVPRPDRVVDPVAAEPSTPFTATAKAVDGSLPRLKFGSTYRFRARLVDLAGGGLRRDQPGSEDATEKIVHRRFEPNPAPELLPTAAYVDGAGPHRMVVRTERGTDAAAYAAAHGYPAAELRYLFPPKSSFELALQYEGAFSTAFGPDASLDEVRNQFATATRADKDVADIAGARLEAAPDGSGTYVVVPADPPFPKPAWLADRGTIWVNLRNRPRPTDPVTGNPGTADGFDSKDSQSLWRGTWPDMEPIALRVEPAVSGCTIRRSPGLGPRTFTVSLGPAEQVTVDIPSCPSMLTVPDLGIPHWAGATQDASNPVNIEAEYGRNPLVSPPRTVTLVHAVQRPLVHPTGRFRAVRHMGDTDAELETSAFNIDVRSTGRIDVQAEWNDVEDIAPAQPVTRRVVANVGSFEIAHKPPLLKPPDGAFPPMRHEFGDTRRRKVRYTVTAVSRFGEYFGRVIAQDPQACTVTGKLAEATDVASTTRPPAPKVRHVVPSARWTRSVEGGGAVIRSSRSGGGLRVMLERPWFVTGADEALAVLAWPRSSASPTDRQRRHLSLAGRDPLQATTTLPAVLDDTHVRADVSGTVKPAELQGAPVVAMAYHLDASSNYDEEADCWFVDLDVSPLAAASYRPFVRLALARYQENTADLDQQLSPPLAIEPVRLLPPRDLVITRNAGRAGVVLSGPGPTGPPFTTVRAELQAFAGDPRAARDGLIGPSGWTTLAQATGRLGDNLVLDLRPTDARPMRIAVTEAESAPGAAGGPTGLVYADIAELT